MGTYNHYDVIYLDMTNILGETDKGSLTSFIRRKITEELLAAYPDLQADESFFPKKAILPAGNGH